MKLGKILKVALIIVLVPIIFIGGVLVGNSYNITDFLCPTTATPHVLQEDFTSKDGIVFPMGTVIALRQCAYMQRFNYHFAIDNIYELKPLAKHIDGRYGFAELYPKSK